MSVPKLLTTEEVAECLRTTPSTLANWRHLGRGPAYVKEGGFVRYSVEAVAEWVQERTVETRP